ncbi:hypothetical protein EWS82_13255, partial [Staphylococcus xylosus]|nr:hypothetical protein [Staphylococcus xylosus]
DLIGHQGAIDCIAISSDGKLLASGSSDNSVNIWNIAENVCIPNMGHRPRADDPICGRA